VNRMQQDLRDLGLRLWPDDSRLRPHHSSARRASSRVRSRLAAAVVGALTFTVLFGVIALSLFVAHPNTNGSGIIAFPPGDHIQGCGQPHLPTVSSAPISVYRAPGVQGIVQVTTGPDGNLWFVGGTGASGNGLVEVIGRMTPSGVTKLYPLPGNPGLAFAGITAGPDANLWFTYSTNTSTGVGRLSPTTGLVALFPLTLPPSVPPVPPADLPLNTQATDIIAGPDGNLWFDVDQIAGEGIIPRGYVGQITPTGTVTLYAVPATQGAQPKAANPTLSSAAAPGPSFALQPETISVGADGNLWSRLANFNGGGCLPGYSPTSSVVRVTPAGQVTILTEDSSKFAGYRLGPGGDYWWMTSTGAFRRTSPTGTVTNFPADTQLGFWDPTHFVVGPDQNLWYVDGSSLFRMTKTGSITRYHAPGGNSGATWITAGPDGRLWFVEGASGAGSLGALRPST
jgi:streptogramin lyase